MKKLIISFCSFTMAACTAFHPLQPISLKRFLFLFIKKAKYSSSSSSNLAKLLSKRLFNVCKSPFALSYKLK